MDENEISLDTKDLIMQIA